MDDTKRRWEIQDFTFDRCKRGNQGFERILLQLFGYLGHGKSSFINTIMCVWSNSKYKNYAKAVGSYGGNTTERQTYQLTKKIVLVDNRGCASMNTYETGEIFAQLGNLLPLGQQVGYSKGFELADRIVEAQPYVKASDFIIPIFVYSVRNTPTQELKEELKEIFKTATKLTMVVPTVVLTHKTHDNYKEIKNLFIDIGADKIFDLENYTEKNPNRIKKTDEEIISFLHEVIKDAQFRANEPRNADQEMIDRKLFVLNFIHNRELENQRKILEKQKQAEKNGMEQVFRQKQEEVEKTLERNRKLHRERMERLEREFERQRLRDQFEHEQRMKQLDKKKGKDKKK
ncbi:coiled-coil domain-containing protein 196 [Leptodactylus fuscus]|uniref:coiled-coil domain-containing protein 196 n=1 Tax=Leptodactylus fuscus TaxID=238119 RepID=UPI003F4EE479